MVFEVVLKIALRDCEGFPSRKQSGCGVDHGSKLGGELLRGFVIFLLLVNPGGGGLQCRDEPDSFRAWDPPNWEPVRARRDHNRPLRPGSLGEHAGQHFSQKWPTKRLGKWTVVILALAATLVSGNMTI